MTRLVRESPCDCGRYDEHDEHGWSGLLREELDVDYEAGARGRYDHHRRLLVAIWEEKDKLMILPEWDELPEDERRFRINEAKIVIDSALGCGA